MAVPRSGQCFIWSSITAALFKGLHVHCAAMLALQNMHHGTYIYILYVLFRAGASAKKACSFKGNLSGPVFFQSEPNSGPVFLNYPYNEHSKEQTSPFDPKALKKARSKEWAGPLIFGNLALSTRKLAIVK